MPEPARPPELALLERIDQLEREVRKLNRRAPTSITGTGPRSDLPSGKGPRWQLGLLPDGVHYGYVIWSSTGVFTVVAQT
jgi:hypothetical protein